MPPLSCFVPAVAVQTPYLGVASYTALLRTRYAVATTPHLLVLCFCHCTPLSPPATALPAQHLPAFAAYALLRLSYSRSVRTATACACAPLSTLRTAYRTFSRLPTTAALRAAPATRCSLPRCTLSLLLCDMVSCGLRLRYLAHASSPPYHWHFSPLRCRLRCAPRILCCALCAWILLVFACLYQSGGSCTLVHTTHLYLKPRSLLNDEGMNVNRLRHVTTTCGNIKPALPPLHTTDRLPHYTHHGAGCDWLERWADIIYSLNRPCANAIGSVSVITISDSMPPGVTGVVRCLPIVLAACAGAYPALLPPPIPHTSTPPP